MTPCSQRPHEIVGDDVAATGDVDDPGVRLHLLELAARDHALGLGRERERQDHHVGTGECVDVAVGFDHVVGAVHLGDPVAHDGDVTVERGEQPQQRTR